MKALVKERPAPGEVSYRDCPDPEVGPSDVLVAVRRAGLCGTDLSMHEWNRTIMAGYKPELPLVMGHEFAGELAEVGSEVTGLRQAYRVTVDPTLICGACRFCRAGRSMLCSARRVMGLQAPGAFAEYAAVPAANVHRLPESVPWDLAGLAEPFAVAVHALERAPVAPGDVVAVVGPGSVGFCLLATLKLAPAARVLMVGLEADRHQLELAESMGAMAVRTDRDDAGAVARELTDGFGADVVFETAGYPRAVEEAIRMTRKGGRVALVGLPHDVSRIDTALLAMNEQEIFGVRAYDLATWRRLPGLLERASGDLCRQVTHRLPMSRFERAAEVTRSREGIKVLLAPEG